MRVVEYESQDFPALARAAKKLGSGASLLHQPFVDHYYLGHPGCRFYLAKDDAGEVIGTLGIDRMPMRHGDRNLVVGSGTNFYSLVTGVGGFLFLKWIRMSPIGLVFGGSADTHHIISSRRWTYIPGMKIYRLNRQIEFYDGEPAWRKHAKRVLRWLQPPVVPEVLLAKMPQQGFAGLSAVEESAYTDDLLPAKSSFTFRLTPDAEYLRWRYGLGLPFVRYRLFRILRQGATAGYVIVNDQKGRVMVAQTDGDDAATLARGILLSIVHVTRHDTSPREVSLVSSHPTMQAIFNEFGFRPSEQDRPFVLGTSRGPVDLPLDTDNWLVNLDWADNGLRAPFLDS